MRGNDYHVVLVQMAFHIDATNSSGVESKRSALHAGERGDLHMRWSYSKVDLAHLAALAMLPPLLVGMH